MYWCVQQADSMSAQRAHCGIYICNKVAVRYYKMIKKINNLGKISVIQCRRESLAVYVSYAVLPAPIGGWYWRARTFPGTVLYSHKGT
jgi:hypothetical protein